MPRGEITYSLDVRTDYVTHLMLSCYILILYISIITIVTIIIMIAIYSIYWARCVYSYICDVIRNCMIWDRTIHYIEPP